jgi:hypothetical protein
LANSADVAILDWELEGRKVRGSETCQSAIRKILEQDKEAGGRLRLIVIFTGTDGRQAIRDLQTTLKEFGAKPSESGCSLAGSQWRIVVFQKPHTITPTAELVDYPDLPGKVVEEFSKLTDGLLPTAVLHGITAIRENTHRLLAVFDRDLDGAFLTHRALIPEPEDSGEFLLGLLQDEIGALIRNAGLHKCIDAKACEKWIEAAGLFKEEAKKKKRLIKAISEPSRNKSPGFVKDLFSVAGEAGNKAEPTSREIADKVLSAFYSAAPDSATEGEKRFSELASYYGIGIRPKLADIWLRLGVIVWDESESRYLMCLQPLCDSVRVKKGALFPFLVLDLLPDNDMKMPKDLFVRTLNGGEVWLQVDPSPKKLVSLKFNPARIDGVAPVEAKEDDGKYVFESVDQTGGRKLMWIHDVKLGKAQRIASGLASRFHTLGIDEFEWQRIHQGPNGE